MSDTTNAAAPQPPAQAPSAPAQTQTAPATPAAPAAAAPPAQPAAPSTAAQPPSKPYVNPWASKPIAKPAPSVAPAQAAPAGQPAQPAPAPAQPSEDVARLRSDLDAVRSVLAITAQRDLNALPENVRTFVIGRAGDDPAAQIREVESLRAAGMIPSAPMPPGATTAPTGTPPAPQTTVASTEAAVLAEYERLRAFAPMAAASFRTNNASAIESALRARGRN